MFSTARRQECATWLKKSNFECRTVYFTRVCIKVDFNRHLPQRLSKNIYFYFFSLFLSNGFYLVSTLHCCGRKWTAIIQNLNCNNKCKILQNVKPYIENFWVCVRSSPFQTNLGWSINHVAKILGIFDPVPLRGCFYLIRLMLYNGHLDNLHPLSYPRSLWMTPWNFFSCLSIR